MVLRYIRNMKVSPTLDPDFSVSRTFGADLRMLIAFTVLAYLSESLPIYQGIPIDQGIPITRS